MDLTTNRPRLDRGGQGTDTKTRRRAGSLLAATALLAGLALAPTTAGAAGAPAVTVTPATGANAAGQAFAVSGSDFSTTANGAQGIYVAFGPDPATLPADWFSNAGYFQATAWVHPNSTTAPSATNQPMAADGSFSFSLTKADGSAITAAYDYVDSSSVSHHVDCTSQVCGIVTMAAHGSSLRTQDTFTPVSFAPAVQTPTITVTPTIGADPGAQVYTVTGSGFNASPGSPGIYLAFGYKDLSNPAWYSNGGLYETAKYIRLTGPSPETNTGGRLNADGTFSVTLKKGNGSPLTAAYTGAAGPVDCTEVSCSVLTFAAQGSADRSQDTAVPITFASASAAQNITATLNGGPLTLSSAGSSVALPAVALNGTDQTTSGALNPLTVTDMRSTSLGWNLIGQSTAFTGPNGATIPAADLGWAPTASIVTGTLPGDPTQPAPTVSAGANVVPGMGLGSAKTLCSSPAGSSTGAFTCGGQLTLGIPANARAGTYVATLTLTLV